MPRFDRLVRGAAAIGAASRVVPLSLASQQVLIVLSGSGKAITDAYALIKLISREYARRDFLVLHHQCDLDDARDPGNRLHVPDIGFDRRDIARPVGGARSREDAAQRFDLDRVPPGAIAQARLELHFAPTGWGLASNLGDSGFTVYGIRDDSLDDWSGGELDWSAAPANDPESGTALVTEKVVELGSFVLPRGIQSGSFGIAGETLAAFLNADGNRRASLVIVRDTSEVRGGGLVHAIASSRHTTLPAPALVLRVGE